MQETESQNRMDKATAAAIIKVKPKTRSGLEYDGLCVHA